MKTVKQPNEKVIAIIKTDRPKSEGLRLSGQFLIRGTASI